jgi:hypothetical protein
VLEYVPREYTLALEESIASNLEDEGFRPSNPPITDLSAPLLIHVVPPEVTSPDHRIFRRLAMEETNATSSGSPHTPIPIVARGGVVPLPPPSPTRTTANQTHTTFGSGTIPTTIMTIFPSI